MEPNVLESGIYYITNVYSKNLAAILEPREGAPVQATTDMIQEDHLSKWMVIKHGNGQYRLKHMGTECYARSPLNPQVLPRPAVESSTMVSRFEFWSIVENNVRNTYSIIGQNSSVFWGSEDREVHSPIVLYRQSTRPHTYWEFLTAHEVEEAMKEQNDTSSLRDVRSLLTLESIPRTPSSDLQIVLDSVIEETKQLRVEADRLREQNKRIRGAGKVEKRERQRLAKVLEAGQKKQRRLANEIHHINSGSEHESFNEQPWFCDWSSEDESKATISLSSVCNSLTWSPSGTMLAAACTDGTVRLYNLRTGKQMRRFLHGGNVVSAAFSPDESRPRVVSASAEGKIFAWDVASRAWVPGFIPLNKSVVSPIWSPDATHIAIGSLESIVVLNSNATKLKEFTGHIGPVISLAFSSDGTRIASGSQDKSVRIWNAFNGLELGTFTGHSGKVNAVVFAPDGTRLITGSEDKTVRVWDSVGRQTLALLEGHTNVVTSVAVSPEGARIASASADRSVCLWDSALAQLITRVEGHENTVTSVAFSPYGQRLASASSKTIRIWAISDIVLPSRIRLQESIGSEHVSSESDEGDELLD